jgi:hypothetical protein
LIASDVSGDGETGAYDAALVLQFSVSLIDEFPVQSREEYVYPVAELKVMQSNNELIIRSQGELYSFVLDLGIDIAGQGITVNSDDVLNCENNGKIAIASAYSLNGEICTITLPDMINLTGTMITGSVNETDIQLYVEYLPEITQLDNIYPNPFNPITNIGFSLSQTENVKIAVYNVKGQKVAMLLDEVRLAGEHRISWNAENTASGIYFLQFNTDSTNSVHRLVLIK